MTSCLISKRPFCLSVSGIRKSGSHDRTTLGPLFAEGGAQKLTLAGQVQEAFPVGGTWLDRWLKFVKTSQRC